MRLQRGDFWSELKIDQLWNASQRRTPGPRQIGRGSSVAQLADAHGQPRSHRRSLRKFRRKSSWTSTIGPADYWQAVDRNLRSRWQPHPPALRHAHAGHRGQRRHDRQVSASAYGGPVRGEITSARRVFIEELNYEEQKSELTHGFQVNLKFTWEDRFQIVGYAGQPELVEAVTDNHVVLLVRATLGKCLERHYARIAASHGQHLKLNPVPVTAQSFDMFTVRWGLIAVGEPAVLEIKEVRTAKTFAQDDVAASITAIERGPGGKLSLTLSVTRDLAMPDPREVIFQEYTVEVMDGDGRKFRVQSQSPSLSDTGVQLKLALVGESPNSEPVLIKLHYPRIRSRRNVELTFRNVPLPTGKPE